MRENKIDQIRLLMENYTEGFKQRGRMYGHIPDVEQTWIVFEDINCILDDLPPRTNLWFEFCSMKGFGAARASYRIKEMRLKDPYLKLLELRNEFEKWRKKRLRALKTEGKLSKAPKVTKYKKIRKLGNLKSLLLGSNNAWATNDHLPRSPFYNPLSDGK